MEDVELLEKIHAGLRKKRDELQFPDFGSCLDVPAKELEIFLIDTQERFIITCVKK